ncbi:MAG: hypothetical protein KDC98_02945 [Planctomycetes bacterium]|nr:hypothetical protein [Planctomycetota bacterium]
MVRITTVLLTSLALSTAALAQSASFTPYGRGCQLPGQLPPRILAQTQPQIGTAFVVTHQGLPANQYGTPGAPFAIDWPFMTIGFAQASLPMPLLPQQPAGCLILTTADIVTPMVWSGSSYPNTYTINLPNAPYVLGTTFYMQWASLYIRFSGVPSPEAWMVRSTDAATVVVGT